MRRLTLTAQQYGSYVERLARGGDVVDPEDVGAGGERERVGCDGRAEPLADLAAGDRAEEALARRPDHDRAPELGELAEASQQLEVVLERLAEPNARIDGDPRLVDPGPNRDLDPLGQKRA